MAIPNNSEEIRRRALAAFTEIKLDYFRANPEATQPFESCTISWKLNKPQGIRYTLNGRNVTPTGSTSSVLVQTTTFRLLAHFSTYSHAVASIIVPVTLQSCVTVGTNEFELENLFASELKAGLEESEAFAGCYFPEGWEPVVKITDNDFHFRARFKKRIAYFPNPTVTMEAHFQIGVEQTRDELVMNRIYTRPKAIITSNTPSLDVPWYAWLVPGAVPALSIALGMASDTVRAGTVEAAQKLAEGVLEFIRLLNANDIPPGYLLHRVRLFQLSGAGGAADARFCPNPDTLVLS